MEYSPMTRSCLAGLDADRFDYLGEAAQKTQRLRAAPGGA
jgi:hypothetical protein